MADVLLVEDDADIRELVSVVLGEEGYSVTCAANGQEALEILRSREEPPCLVLLDLMMPILSGPELLEILAEEGALPALPVVVVSALAESGSAPGVRRFLRKPVPPDLLLEVVAEYCGRPRAS